MERGQGSARSGEGELMTLKLNPIKALPVDWTPRLVIWTDVQGLLIRAVSMSGKQLSIRRSSSDAEWTMPAGWIEMPSLEVEG